MAFVLGFVCGILAPWMAYRVRKMIEDNMSLTGLFTYDEEEFEDVELEEDEFIEEEEIAND